jgi:hypothetical protein
MENLQNKAGEPFKGKNRSIRTWKMVMALALFAALLALAPSMGTYVALADSNSSRNHNYDVTFTKWVTTIPNMEGVVGGDVGTGTFAGEILDFVPGAVITKIEALYHISGGTYSFSAHVFVRQNERTHIATIRGVVTDGWQKGRQVHGTYAVISCPDKTNGVCFQGTLHIHGGSERGASD